MKDQFYIVLPSNSSMSYFEDNTTTHFITKLPQHLTFHGTWCVALTEIQIPMTFQHVPVERSERYVKLISNSGEGAQISNDVRVHDASTLHRQQKNDKIAHVQHGVYTDIHSFLIELNELSCIKNHLTFDLNPSGQVKIKSVCTESFCTAYNHELKLSARLRKILGFDSDSILFEKNEIKLGNCPANLYSGLPTMLMIYSDICEPIITGDVQSPLLRAVSLGTPEYEYGSSRVKSFSPCMYIPLLSSSFSTIEIDIKDDLGQPILFDSGTLTVTLHFKRLD